MNTLGHQVGINENSGADDAAHHGHCRPNRPS
jgi:hypothetical protein